MCRTCSSFNLKYSTLYTSICLKSHTFNTFAALLIIKVVFNTKNVFFVKLGNINQISFFVQNRRLQMSSISNETYLASSLSFLVKHIFFPVNTKNFFGWQLFSNCVQNWYTVYLHSYSYSLALSIKKINFWLSLSLRYFFYDL